jgi:hypothetical protein
VVSAVLGDDFSSSGAIDRSNDLALPSVNGLVTTLSALDRTVGSVVSDCREISSTLTSLSEALQMFGQGGRGGGTDWGGFGLIGLPIAGAIRAAKGVASQYVKQQTGTPLSTWTDFVVSSEDQFRSFLAALDQVADVAQRYRTTADGQIEPEQAREDFRALSNIRWEIQAWKLVLGRVTQLGQVVDAILRVDLGGDAGTAEPEAPTVSSGFGGTLQRRIKEVQSRTVDKSGDVGAWVLHPFVEIKEKVRQLPTQVAHVSGEVGLFEVLLELELAEIRACLGEISPTEAEVVGLRVAASVLLPELAHDIAEVKQRIGTYEMRLDRLRGARGEGVVDDRIYAILAQEYEEALQVSRSRLAELEVQADLWRRDGPAILDACASWLGLELQLLAARQLAEQTDAFGEHRSLLQRERERLDEARPLLASL